MKSLVINIVDYGMGNLQSVRNAFERLGCVVHLSADAASWVDADAVVLPGVGAFGEAMTNLNRRRLIEPLRRDVLEKGKHLLGICLGMQLLADSSEERGMHEGLSLIPGHVRHIPVSGDLRLPHIGWNVLDAKQPAPLFRDFPKGGAVYFVHSYYYDCDPKYVGATTDYGGEITAAVQSGRIFGVQFHPERSQRKGLELLRNFVAVVQDGVGAN